MTCNQAIFIMEDKGPCRIFASIHEVLQIWSYYIPFEVQFYADLEKYYNMVSKTN